jgi:hypothetical protein
MMMSIKMIALAALLAGTSLFCQATTHGTHNYNGYGVNFRVDNGYFAYLDDKPCALDEKTAKATVYSAGLYQVIVYKTGKVALLKQGVYVGDLEG